MTKILPLILIIQFFYYVVQLGDTLWGISEEFLGAGWRYHEIVESNSRQILDPHWIYPGQVFVIPTWSNDE